MKLFALIIWISLASISNAQSVSVTSGEHDGFSRLVLTFSKPVDWTLSRKGEGYNLSTEESITRYDFSDAFRRLTAKRLTDLKVDPKSGAILITLNCACYAMPFELRRGVLVIDITDGVAPDGSSFEFATDGKLYPPLTISQKKLTGSALKPKTQKTNEKPSVPSPLNTAIDSAARVSSAATSALPTTVSVEKIRDELLWQLSKGAGTGLVDIADGIGRGLHDSSPVNGSENIRVGAEIGIEMNSANQGPNHMTDNGKNCLSNEQLDIAAWLPEVDAVSTFSQNTTGLVGEFDYPDAANISRTVKYLLALGFGAEGRVLLKAFSVSVEDHNVLEAISHIVDLEELSGGVFQNMEICNTSAAFWAILANSEVKKVDTPSVLRAFSGLPLHLRRHLGPSLADKFLARNDTNTARAIRDAILRAPGNPDDPIKMMQAGIELANGMTKSAEEILVPLSGTIGTAGILSTVALINAQIDAGEEIDKRLTMTGEALLHEAKGGMHEPALREAVALAYASQDRFQEAFGLISKVDDESLPIWRILADMGSDSALLSEAIVNNLNAPPELPPEIIRRLANRLLKLGFPDQTLFWLIQNKNNKKPLSEEDRIVAATAELAQNNGIAALEHLSGVVSKDAEALRARILATLADRSSIGELKRTDQIDAAARTARHQNQWLEIVGLGQNDIWQDVAKLAIDTEDYINTVVQAVDAPASGENAHKALAHTRSLLEESSDARIVLKRLLSEETRLAISP